MLLSHTDTQDLISLSEAARTLFPGETSPSTVWRWATRGLVAADPSEPRIKLEIIYSGKRPYTTREAVRRFLDAITVARLERMERSRSTDRSATVAELRAAGL